MAHGPFETLEDRARRARRRAGRPCPSGHDVLELPADRAGGEPGTRHAHALPRLRPARDHRASGVRRRLRALPAGPARRLSHAAGNRVPKHVDPGAGQPRLDAQRDRTLRGHQLRRGTDQLGTYCAFLVDRRWLHRSGHGGRSRDRLAGGGLPTVTKGAHRDQCPGRGVRRGPARHLLVRSGPLGARPLADAASPGQRLRRVQRQVPGLADSASRDDSPGLRGTTAG